MASKPTYEELEERVKELEREALERSTAEAALPKREEKFRNIYNRVQVGIFRTRFSDGKVLECNDRFAKTYGFDSREECMKDCVVAEHYVDLGTREQLLAQLRESGEVNDFEARFYRKEGEIAWVRFSARSFPEEGFLEGFGYDITREKEAMEALRESEALLSHTQQIAHVGSWVLDVAENRLTWSEETYRIFGLNQAVQGFEAHPSGVNQSWAGVSVAE